jgi:hypothetical protein
VQRIRAQRVYVVDSGAYKRRRGAKAGEAGEEGTEVIRTRWFVMGKVGGVCISREEVFDNESFTVLVLLLLN